MIDNATRTGSIVVHVHVHVRERVSLSARVLVDA
jgi:hypothetical protein